MPEDKSKVMALPLPEIVAVKVPVFVPTLQLIFTFAPLTEPETESQSPGTGPYKYFAAIARISLRRHSHWALVLTGVPS